MMSNSGFIELQIADRLVQFLPVSVVRQRAGTLGGKAQVHDHQHFFVLRQAQRLSHLLRIKEVDPAAVHARIGRGQDHVRRDNGGILHAGVTLLTRISENIPLVKRHDQHRRRPVAAGRHAVDLREGLRALYDIDPLFLQVLGRGGQPSGVQNCLQLLLLHLFIAVLLAGIPRLNNFFKFHITVLPPSVCDFSAILCSHYTQHAGTIQDNFGVSVSLTNIYTHRSRCYPAPAFCVMRFAFCGDWSSSSESPQPWQS